MVNYMVNYNSRGYAVSTEQRRKDVTSGAVRYCAVWVYSIPAIRSASVSALTPMVEKKA